MSSLLTQNFFEIFGLTPRFVIDISHLSARFRDLQQVVHPDRFATASDVERRHSMQLTAHVNEAYQTLKKPLSRARYLLELRGLDISHGAILGNEFLIEQMELREQLAEILQQPEPLVAIMALRKALSQQLNELQQQFAEFLDQNDNQQALSSFNKMQFFSRLQEELNQAQERLSTESN